LRRGVPGSAITRDYAGFDTYDTCIRARDVFGVTGAVVVTQDFHVSRAVFTCRELGIDAVGLAIPDWSFREDELDYRYTRSQEVGYTVREWFARVKAVVDTEVLHPEPKLGGPYEGLTET
jgi:vancomycin permeability regulator SanA